MMQHHNRKTGSAMALALLLSCIGLVAAMTITTSIAYRTVAEESKPTSERFLKMAREREHSNDGRRAFYYYRLAIQYATNRVERNQAALDTAELLVKNGNWERVDKRQAMAADYIIALADESLKAVDLLRLTACALKILPDYRETTFRETTRALINRMPSAESLPYGFNKLAFEAFFALRDASSACAILNVLSTTPVESHRAQMTVRHFRSRAIWRALRDPEWYNALAKNLVAFPANDTVQNQKAFLLDQLNADIMELVQSSVQSYQFEALILSSLLAINEGETSRAIGILQEAIFKKDINGRNLAATRLLEILKQHKRFDEIDKARSAMLKISSLQAVALQNITEELHNNPPEQRLSNLFENILSNLDAIDMTSKSSHDLLAKAADIAILKNDLTNAKRLTDVMEEYSPKPLPPRLCMLKARIARADGKRDDVLRNLYALLSGAPSDQEEIKARFMLTEALSQSPVNITDLVGNSIGNAQQMPQDPRSLEGILTTAKQLESLKLYELALAYYQKLNLLGSIHGTSSSEITRISAEAITGQARLLLLMGRDQEADNILRRINSHTEWSSVWPEAAPLWSAVAMRRGQYREALRRWKQACGPSNDTLLPHLFDILVPDSEAVLIKPGFGARLPPTSPPAQLVRAAADAAFNRLLEASDYAALDQLLSQIDAATQWHSILPLNAYRIRALNHMQASQPADRVLEWMEKHGIEDEHNSSDESTLWSSEDLRKRLIETDALTMRARTTFF